MPLWYAQTVTDKFYNWTIASGYASILIRHHQPSDGESGTGTEKQKFPASPPDCSRALPDTG
jgi:hypothetical protein